MPHSRTRAFSSGGGVASAKGLFKIGPASLVDVGINGEPSGISLRLRFRVENERYALFW